MIRKIILRYQDNNLQTTQWYVEGCSQGAGDKQLFFSIIQNTDRGGSEAPNRYQGRSHFRPHVAIEHLVPKYFAWF